MRLTAQEAQQIEEAVASFLRGSAAELRLFGSRADDRAKGGDIDLLLSVEDPGAERSLKAEKHLILSEIKRRIGDQKIDLRIARLGGVLDPFLSSVIEGAVVLRRWE